jgi:hypothetical protein
MTHALDQNFNDAATTQGNNLLGYSQTVWAYINYKPYLEKNNFFF